MATMPNLNQTDPWTLTQKFIEQQNKDASDEKKYKMARELALLKAAGKLQYDPYTKRMMTNQADIDSAKIGQNAGLDVRGRYRTPGSGSSKGFTGDKLPGDPAARKEF